LSRDVLSKDKYAVFISYRHVGPDRHWAVWLHGALESFVIPFGLRGSPDRRRIGRVFRDEDELAASPHFSADIEDALNRSDWLVIVCSPRAVESEWVSAEVLHFRGLGRDNQILALLIDGEPAVSFPPALFEIRRSTGSEALAPDEPLAADVRPRREITSRTANRWAKLRLLATILGCKFDDLRQREQERQNRRLVLVATAAVIGLAVVGLLGGWAELNRREAVQQKIVATENESRALTALSLTASSQGHYTDAVKLALAAWPRSTSDERPQLSRTIDALAQALAGPLEVSPSLQHDDAVGSAAFSPDGTRVVTASNFKGARIWEVATGRPIGQPLEHPGITSAAFSRDGTRLVTASTDNTARSGMWQPRLRSVNRYATRVSSQAHHSAPTAIEW
jgi:hypothetical protein